MFDLHTISFLLIFIAAGLVKGVTGMGLPTVAMGLLGLLMPPQAAAALLVLPSLLTNLWQLLAGPALAAGDAVHQRQVGRHEGIAPADPLVRIPAVPVGRQPAAVASLAIRRVGAGHPAGPASGWTGHPAGTHGSEGG